MSDGNNPFELEPEEPRKDPAPAAGNGRMVPEPAPPPPPPPVSRPAAEDGDGEVDTRTVAERKGDAPPRATEELGNPPDWPQEAFRFPMGKGGPAFMAFVIVPFFLLDLVGLVPGLRFPGWALKFVFLVFVLRTQFAVIGSSAAGYDEPRDWKNGLQFDRDDFRRYAWTLALFLGVLAPGIVFWAFDQVVVGLPLVIAGSMYAAVIALGAALKDAALKYPWRAFPWMKARPLCCLAGCAAWWVLIATEPALYGLRDQSFSIAAFVALALRAVGAFLLLVSARALGVMGRAWKPA